MAGVVRVVYLVSRDSRERRDFREAIWNAIVDVRWWYRQQLGGPTFRLGPGVEVLQSNKNGAWFDGYNREKPHTHYYRALQEVARLRGARQNDPRNCWAIYSDAPGNNGSGTSGACMMPLDDLLGLVGEHPTQKSQRRWIGGLAHELGHAMRLHHPSDTKKHANAIMALGFSQHYPKDAYLTAADKSTLRSSPYIEGAGLSGRASARLR